MGQYNIIILNVFLVIITFLVSYPTVQGYKSLDYSTGKFYGYPWRSFNPRKRMETGEERNESALDGEVLVGDPNMGGLYKPIIFKFESPINDGDILYKPKRSSANEMRTRNSVQNGNGIKVLYKSRVPGTLMFWPTTL